MKPAGADRVRELNEAGEKIVWHSQVGGYESRSDFSLRGDALKVRSEEPIPDVLRLPRREPATRRQMRRLACRLRW
jgi:hypothetical protein